jgi:two-component system cell cycle sensor histidine kinase/response regulator CckA
MSESSLLSSLKRAFRDDKPVARGPARALVVDDEETIRRFVTRVLQDHGYPVSTAEDGPSALAIAGKEEAFDLLVTDLMMPQMNGDELARQMRKLQPALKVLYLTGYSDKLFKDKVTLWEGEAFLDKPCSIKGLLEAVSLLTVGHIQEPRAESQ